MPEEIYKIFDLSSKKFKSITFADILALSKDIPDSNFINKKPAFQDLAASSDYPVNLDD